ncbi:MAG: tRNA (guanosine(37)-N1)-methyltransferase TrmD [Syntrophomonadaceae bacterium]|nr:tRNA (guanosine(37)-N1)-methyltransferase TrmD [Syntrophomonadaceae bacterium]MDD3022654.1 tRNA (guanosine(37)-N1)-methyltransferase TrmD [Syntrophomonadaceae bacterium]
MKIDILTLFPEMFVSPLGESIIKRARERKLVNIATINIRDFAYDKHQQVDDYPFGGGAGMVMKADVVAEAMESVKKPDSWTIFMSPQGKPLKQNIVAQLAKREHLIILCGHYEGIDERIMRLVDEEISIGDYILTGGEIPAMVLIDAAIRLLPGVLGGEQSPLEESFAGFLLEYPQYTRPASYKEHEVPQVLLSGHHENIRRWRKKQSLLRTLLKRPDLLLDRDWDQEETSLIKEILFNREK